MKTYSKFIITDDAGESTVLFAYDVAFTPTHVVFRDRDGVPILALLAPKVISMSPVRDRETGEVLKFSDSEASAVADMSRPDWR